MQFDTLASKLIQEARKRKVPKSFTLTDNGMINAHSLGIVSLKGIPKIVPSTVWLQNNKLTTLEDGPEIVGGDFHCEHNKITSLKGAPKMVKGTFFCYANTFLTSLEGVPDFIGGSFVCTGIPNLDPLELAKWDLASKVNGDIHIGGGTFAFYWRIAPYPKEKCTRAYYDLMTKHTGTKEQQELGEI